MDGHNSHYSIELLEYARENLINILAYPPHTTHALQGHDVVLFAPLKLLWMLAFREWERVHRQNVTKDIFLLVLEQPFLKCFNEKNILSSFRATGIWPYDPEVIKVEQMRPSEGNAVWTGLPNTASSPVKAMVAAFYSSPIKEMVN